VDSKLQEKLKRTLFEFQGIFDQIYSKLPEEKKQQVEEEQAKSKKLSYKERMNNVIEFFKKTPEIDFKKFVLS